MERPGIRASRTIEKVCVSGASNSPLTGKNEPSLHSQAHLRQQPLSSHFIFARNCRDEILPSSSMG
jgi:hypothetical protein